MSQILTSTGKRFDLFEPDADLIDQRDIAHSLAHLCRFNGHTREFYSVAQHCCMVRPLKQWMHAYQDVEDCIWDRICTRFGLDRELPASVRQADLIALATERRDLMPADPAIWDCLIGIEPMAETIRPWSATEARLTYHRRLMDQLVIEHRRKAA